MQLANRMVFSEDRLFLSHTTGRGEPRRNAESCVLPVWNVHSVLYEAAETCGLKKATPVADSSSARLMG